VAELEQIDRQQQADEAVANRPDAARGEQEARLRRGAERQVRLRFPARVSAELKAVRSASAR
jgi:hypothetical protein